MALQFLSPLHKASRQFSVYFAREMSGAGLSPQEAHVMSFLRSYAPCPISELVTVFGIKQSTLTSMLDRLEAPGYLRREVNPGDRRSFLIHLTPEGTAIADEFNRFILDFEHRVRGLVNQEQIRGFEAVMAAFGELTQVELRRQPPPGDSTC